ncbi:MAG TPA: symmetrical bis(5'-nucleosyl)-tetraphosphatase [Thermoanaerobaculia bacterium]|nr:symmetrical bis(5'-nucleosyl)-tetraphosphatase [Thermoanaerobaculia bacterium]
MATYAIGDVHGCFATLKRLLRRIAFDRRQDRLWMVGDLVNRGPRSLEVLRWAVDLDGRIVAVLGNHDLHLLARARGLARARRRDTLEPVLEARDRDDLLAWLHARPLLHREGSHLLVHAGLLPEWTLQAAEELAREVEEELRGSKAERLFKTLKAEPPGPLRRRLSPLARRRLALSAFTRLRTLSAAGLPCLDFSGPPREAPAGCVPWFAAPGRKNRGARILCGHWAALGLLLENGVAALDTGCVWGQSLTALRLDDGTVFQEPAGEE